MKKTGTDAYILIHHPDLSEKYYTACNTEMQIPLEKHSHFETVITLKNNYMHTVNGVSFRPEVGDVVILRPQDYHSAHPIDDREEHICRDIYIDQALFRETCDFISPTLFVRIMTAKDPPSFHLSGSELASFEESVDFFYLYALAKDYEVYRAVKRIVACRVIGTYVQKSFEADKPLPESLAKFLLLLSHDGEKKMSIKDAARAVDYSPDHMSRLFREYFGKSIEQHLIECRVFDSLALLLQTDLSVDSIAAKMGWKCTGNYIKHFSKIYGTTPAKYRKQYANAVK